MVHRCCVDACSNTKRPRLAFHRFPLVDPERLRQWLFNPHMGPNARVCSDHFLDGDYIEEKAFESDKLVTRRTNKLKPDAVPSVFSLTAGNPDSTVRPTGSDSGGTETPVHRRGRTQKCDSQAVKTQVGVLRNHQKSAGDCGSFSLPKVKLPRVLPPPPPPPVTRKSLPPSRSAPRGAEVPLKWAHHAHTRGIFVCLHG
uniref:THAP domain-containing protein 1 n=1 Tax=Dicentrarchus labrax TaxID=13489 RepID=A0A8C4HMP9_DICLA